MKFGTTSILNRQISLALFLAFGALLVCSQLTIAQTTGGGGTPNPGSAPVFNKAVQGQQATQPEGTLLNVVDWIGNVACPLLAVGAIVMAVVSYANGRGVARWAVTAAGLLMISGLTRLIEAWINTASGITTP